MIIKQFDAGSKYFFYNYPGFSSKDIDVICITNDKNVPYWRLIRYPGVDHFYIWNTTKEQHIEQSLKRGSYFLGQFLIPEFNEYIGFTIEDLPRLEPLLRLLDEKHQYEAIIYNSYLENGEFKLTQQQRDQAYLSYKKSRVV